MNKKRSCDDCWRAMGTQRRTTKAAVQRQCLHTGLLVPVTGKQIGSCSAWAPRPSNAAIARKANSDASNRISEHTEGK